MSYIGIIGAGRLDRSSTEYNLLEQQKIAGQMYSKKIDMHLIKQRTGWEMGIDRKWRYEIPDPFHSTTKIEDHIKKHFGEAIYIRFCMHDTTLLTAYPAFERLQLFARYRPTRRLAGYFNPSSYGMVICMGTAKSPFEYQSEGILLHEVQHLIQEEEDFARGGDTSRGRNRYLRLAGEVEARNVCIRHNLTTEKRFELLRTETQDVPDSQQIVEF